MEISELEKTDVDKVEIQKQLLHLPNIIKKLRNTLMKQESEMDDAILYRKAVENEVALEVYKEKSPEGKQKFSNVATRDAEKSKRLETNTEYAKYKDIEKQLKQSIAESKNDIEFCQMRFRALQLVVPFYYDNQHN